ncbi:MAG: hypothetical protein ACI8W8_005041, partial [Rhodothermales bacterium]
MNKEDQMNYSAQARWVLWATLIVTSSAVASNLKTGFERAPTGAFTEMETELGLWQVGVGTAKIDDSHAKTGSQCLQLTGGERTTVTLDIAEPLADGKLTFWAERWTINPPFNFRIDADRGNGWQALYTGDRAVRAGRAFLSQLDVPLLGGVRRLRFTVTSPPDTGILIDDVRIAPARPKKAVPADWLAASLARPDHAFVAHPEHKLPMTMAVQDTRVRLAADAAQAGLDPQTARWRFDLVQTQGESALLTPDNWARFGASAANILVLDQFGEHVVRIAGRDDSGNAVTTDYAVTCHFSRQVVAGGKTAQIPGTADLMQRSSVNGVVEGG